MTSSRAGKSVPIGSALAAEEVVLTLEWASSFSANRSSKDQQGACLQIVEEGLWDNVVPARVKSSRGMLHKPDSQNGSFAPRLTHSTAQK